MVLDEGESDEMVEERRAHEALMNDDTDDDDSGDDDYSDGDDVLLTEETDENLDPNEARLVQILPFQSSHFSLFSKIGKTRSQVGATSTAQHLQTHSR